MILLCVILAAGIAAWIAFRRSPLDAFLIVYLPVLLFLSVSYGIRFHGVPITPAIAASLPIVAMAVGRQAGKWRWTWTDAAVPLYVLGTYYSDYRTGHDASVSGADGVATALETLVPYLFGRILMEAKDARIKVMKQFVFLVSIIAVISVYEYRMTRNPFEAIESAFFKIPSTFPQQIRWGFARVGGPFGHAIMAGLAFVCVLLFQLWLSSNGHWEAKFRRLRWLPGSKAAWITGILVAGVWMSQSRGPWMGGLLGFILFLAGRAKRMKRGIRRSIFACIVLFSAFYIATDRYTNVSDDAQLTQDQQNAVYRRELITNYMPVVKAGGLFGYGVYFPQVEGQGSIDNHYLLITLEGGYFALGLFLLLLLGTGGRLLFLAWTANDRADATFALCLLGIIVGAAATLATVSLAAQNVAFFYLVVGWAQSLKPRRQSLPAAVAVEPQQIQRFAYRRVFT